jgi:hypothetical protein
MTNATQILHFADDEQPGIYFKGSDAAYFALAINDLLCKFNGDKSLASWSPEELTVLMWRLIKILRSPASDKKQPTAYLKAFKECVEQ